MPRMSSASTIRCSSLYHYLRTGVLGQDHHVPDTHLHFLGVPHRNDLGRLRLLPGCVREDDPASRLLFTLDHLDECSCPKRLQLHLLTSCETLIGRHKGNAWASIYQRAGRFAFFRDHADWALLRKRGRMNEL